MCIRDSLKQREKVFGIRTDVVKMRFNQFLTFLFILGSGIQLIHMSCIYFASSCERVNTPGRNNLYPMVKSPLPFTITLLLERPACKTVIQHFAAKLRIHRLKRNIDRFKVIGNDSFNILVAHIGQSHIISLKEGKTGIIVLKVQGV